MENIESLDTMKNLYNEYINTLCKKFFIIEKRAFSQDVAKHIINRPKDINEDQNKLKQWNIDLFAYIMQYTTIPAEALENMIQVDMGLLLTKEQ